MPASVEDAIKMAISQHPELRVAIADHEASLAQQQGAEAPFHPRVDLDLSARSDKDLDGRKGANKEALAMVRLEYNAYNGGADSARLEQTELLSEEAKTRALIAKRDIENEVRFDIVSIVFKEGKPEIELIEGAFRPWT
jgi:adhesin transport system outer membrane protein